MRVTVTLTLKKRETKTKLDSSNPARKTSVGSQIACRQERQECEVVGARNLTSSYSRVRIV